MKSYGKCTVDQCKRQANYKKARVCQMHYFRKMRYGHFGLNPSKRHRLGYSEHIKGYRLLYLPDHPLSNAGGYVYEHRAVVFEEYGFDLPPCQICGKASGWETRKTHIDHIDEDRANNHPLNLRVVCNPCNVARTTKIHHKYDHCGSVTIGGKTMTPTEWARQPGVNVSGATIRNRIARGYSHSDAVFAAKITHK